MFVLGFRELAKYFLLDLPCIVIFVYVNIEDDSLRCFFSLDGREGKFIFDLLFGI